MTYTPPREHIDYALHRVLNASGTLRRLGVDLDRETIDEVIDGVGTFASEVLAPLNRVGDEEGCTAMRTAPSRLRPASQMRSAGTPQTAGPGRPAARSTVAEVSRSPSPPSSESSSILRTRHGACIRDSRSVPTTASEPTDRRK